MQPTWTERRQKRLGAYYTPEPVAQPLVRWALAGSPGHVLDPSFGGCSFLNVALRIIREMGAPTPGSHIFGVDIDPGALEFTSELRGHGVPNDHLRVSDFFRESPAGGVIPPCRAVVGNPPYIRHHYFQSTKRAVAQRALKTISATLPESASAWAYFVLYASAFVAPGGRLAMLLPTSAWRARYSERVLEELVTLFGRISLVSIRQRLFPDAREGTVVLLASDRGSCSEGVERESARDLAALEEFLAGNDSSSNHASQESAVWTEKALLDASPAVRRLGDLADVRIGVVTGSNSFFVRTREEEQRLVATGVSFVPVISAARQLSMLRWTQRDQTKAERAGRKARLMLVRRKAHRRTYLRSLIRIALDAGLHERSHCRRRDPWLLVQDRRVPDAFLKYMSTAGAPITINDSRATCTNSLHRLYWKRTGDPHAALTVGSRSSLYHLSAELLGRRFGGGLLKLEPSDARQLLVPVIGSAARWAPRMDAMERDGDHAGVRQLADRVVLRDGLGLSWQHIDRIRDALLHFSPASDA